MQINLQKSALVLALALCGSAFAANDQATFGVSASIASECVVGNTTNMAFNTLSMLDTASGGLSTAKDNASATFDAACTSGTGAPTLKFASANGGGSAFALMGGSGTDLITYTLYEGGTDSGTAIAHAADEAFTGFTADGATKSLTVTGQILAADKSGKPKGSYSDTVTITVGFTPDV